MFLEIQLVLIIVVYPYLNVSIVLMPYSMYHAREAAYVAYVNHK